MENLMEMEYVINGEKYIITATKVEDVEDTNTSTEVEVKPEFEDFETVEVENNGLVQLPVTMVPHGMLLEEWLEVIKNYGVILTD